MKRILNLITIDEIRTMTDPYRMEILQVFLKHDKPLTVKDVARALDQPHGKVYYHVKKMVNVGGLEIAHTEKINGITAKYYVIAFDEMVVGQDQMSEDEKKGVENSMFSVVKDMFDEHKNNFVKSLENQKVDHEIDTKVALVAADLRFDEESYEAFTRELEALVEKHKLKEDKPCAKKFFYTLYNN